VFCLALLALHLLGRHQQQALAVFLPAELDLGVRKHLPVLADLAQPLLFSDSQTGEVGGLLVEFGHAVFAGAPKHLGSVDGGLDHVDDAAFAVLMPLAAEGKHEHLIFDLAADGAELVLMGKGQVV
jgi:predicted metallo-beta-lactamase superfamily hydrolase